MDSEQEQQRLLIDQSIEPSLPPFDPLKPAIPISYPLKVLEEFKSRSYFKSFYYPFNIASTTLPTAPSRPRILVCHDMAGDYGDDKWVQGGTNEGAYAIWYWYSLD
ncbi:Cytosolic endo-beta-n-acetylglucosaminidase [Thalictrum thalictroides]|uniref:Cytosolic endo-beta-n-acetylglucosaminidase n=1 Tax=Thalictrum thalictroides TaxID=46969 RepID=A0A7J6XD98_THATH|nr:Cytosolic endo-beta-n-acetylglucosaminidase [Thalictrum thalictroides]